MTTRPRAPGDRAGIVIAGGGLACQRACETLRRSGYDAPIRVIGAEPHPPYDRPPLSKEYLAGERDESTLRFRPPDWYADNHIKLLLGQRATRLDPAAREVTTSADTQVAYKQLPIATGSGPRHLPSAAGYHNVHKLRTLDDAHSLRAELGAGKRLAVVGAGFIGQEVAATAHRLGAHVTLIEAAAAPLAAVLGTGLGRWFARLHRDEGIDVLLSARVQRLRGTNSADAVELADGRRIECATVVVGIGTEPATAWLKGSGLAPEGVPVDGGGRTAIPNVFAAGDASRPFDRQPGVHLPTEHWEAAARQGVAAARAMLGLATPPAPPPMFWSDQHGRPYPVRRPRPRRRRRPDHGGPDDRNFTASFSRRGRPIAALLVGRPDALPQQRRRIHHTATRLPADERTAA
jgi:3-phenylpropionate/trans-cinnamate dioxygenase ferredoxin reductase component